MSRTTTALLVKLIMTLAVAVIAFYLITQNDLFWVLALAVAGTVLNYIIGDLMVLPAAGNVVASIGDGALAALTAYVISLMAEGFDANTTNLAVFGIGVAVGEYFFHQYLAGEKKVEPNPDKERK